uniref:Telomeric repeat-binding factor 2-interacting protein 1 n=1 Tax=Rhipicephalus zambeziensis TaxID=60191 RepID=A0A224Z7M5_9ACAR
MASKPYRQALFVKADGGPMYFAMVPCPERKEIRELIHNGGGVLLQPGKNPDAVHLVPSSIATAQGPEDVFSANYIRACCGSNKLYPLKDFKIPRAPEVWRIDDADDFKERKLRSVRSRREYTLGEQIAMAKYLAKTPNVRVRGNQVYKEMATAGVVPGAHSWQSLKEHYLKKILPWKHLYESPDASKLLARITHAPHEMQVRPRHDSPSAASVIVEDSSSDDESKRQRATGCEAEAGKCDTETEVVLETESQGGASSSQNHGTPRVSQRGRRKTKRKKLLLSSSFFLSSPKTSSGGSPSWHESRISAPREKSSDSTSIETEVVPEKTVAPLRTQSEMSLGKTSRTQTQSPPGKQDSGIGGESTQTVALPETIVNQKQSLRSSPRKARNAKQWGTPADRSAHEEYTSANIHNAPRNDLPDRVLESVSEQQTTQSSPQKEASTATFSKHSIGPPSLSQHLRNRDLAASEEQASPPSKLRSFRLPVRKKRSTDSQANLSSHLSAVHASKLSNNDDAAVDEYPRKRVSRRRRSLRLSPRKRQRATAQERNLDDCSGELAHSESTGDDIIITNALRSSPESVYNAAESEGATQGTKRTRGDGRSVPSPQQASDSAATKTRKRSLRAAALRKNEATSPASEDHCTRSTRWAASREKEQKSVQGVARETPGFDSADEALLARIAEQVSAGHVTAGDDSDEQDNATTLSFSSDGGHSDEESTPELGDSSEHDRMDEVHRELSRLLGVLGEWRSRPPHATCSPRCTCPLTNRYAHAARVAVSLSAFLAFHDRPLPSEGVTDPAVAMTLELFLRRLEQNADVGDGSGSE